MEHDEEVILSDKELKEQERQFEEQQKSGLNLPSEQEDLELQDTGSSVGVQFSTSGRFTTPKIEYYKNYKTKDYNDLALSRQDDMLENLVVILNKKQITKKAKIEDYLPEELFETVIAIKRKFRGDWHVHRWYCEECQSDVDDKDKKQSEMEINLATLKEVSIEEADDNLREFLKGKYEQLRDINPTIFMKQMKLLKSDLDMSIAPKDVNILEVLKEKKVIEPFTLTCPVTKKVYSFRFTRIGDYIKAKRFINGKYASQLKDIKKEKWGNRGSLAEFKESQEFKLKQLNDQKLKDLILCTKAFSLLQINGKDLTDSEKFKEMEEMEPVTAESLAEFLENQKFGIQDEREYTCNLCGHSERGFLQRRTNILEFVLDNSTAIGRPRLNNETVVLFGI